MQHCCNVEVAIQYVNLGVDYDSIRPHDYDNNDDDDDNDDDDNDSGSGAKIELSLFALLVIYLAQ